MKNILFILLVFIVGASAADTEKKRTWTANDGRTLEGKLVSAGTTDVEVRRADGKKFTLKLDSLAEADRDYVAAFLAQQKDGERSFKTGRFAEAIQSEWVKLPKAEHGLVFQVYGSKKLTREKEPVPLFIHLHGAGARADDVEAGKVEIAPQLLAAEKQYKETPCVIVVPLCPTDSGWGKHVAEMEKFIDALTASLPIDRRRIYLSGYSMGARGIDSLIMSRPKFYAAAMFADGDANRKWPETTDTALWLCYSGERDLKKAEEVVKAHKEAGHEAQFQGFPDATHNGIHWKLAKDEKIFPWLFEQVREE